LLLEESGLGKLYHIPSIFSDRKSDTTFHSSGDSPYLGQKRVFQLFRVFGNLKELECGNVLRTFRVFVDAN
jgi:hypothetical protein